MRNRTRWGIAAAVTATLIVLGGMYLNATGTTPAGPTIDPLARFQHQPIAWHDCQLGENDEDGKELDDAHAECADVTVPLDYSHPDRRTTTVAISRVKATDTGHRIGIMIFNLGGPALPVLTEVVDVRKEMGEAGARFDLIGMDPRFTNRSTPLDCGLPNNWLALSAGADRQGFDRSLLRAQDVATRCLQESLVVGAAGDIGAVLSQQQAMHQALTASRMITLNTRTHLVYLYEDSTCVNDAVNTYLTTGHLPTHDLTCARSADH